MDTLLKDENETSNPFPCPVVTVDDTAEHYIGKDELYIIRTFYITFDYGLEIRVACVFSPII